MTHRSDLIRVLIADDHAVVREGLLALLGTEPDIDIVGAAPDGLEAMRLALSLRPDVILMDYQMPHASGLEAIQGIIAEWPEARMLVLTSFGEDEKVFGAIKAGAMGYLLKDATPEELVNAIRNIHHGRSALDPDVALKVIHELHKPTRLPPTQEPLTEREVEVLQLVATGLSNNDIAVRLVVSERTVRTHISNILGKLHLANRTQAALYALKEGLARLDAD